MKKYHKTVGLTVETTVKRQAFAYSRNYGRKRPAESTDNEDPGHLSRADLKQDAMSAV